jgi:hypothetical protein
MPATLDYPASSFTAVLSIYRSVVGDLFSNKDTAGIDPKLLLFVYNLVVCRGRTIQVL